MKKVLVVVMALLCVSGVAMAGDKKKKGKEEKKVAYDSVIHWMTINEAEAAMKKNPKRVFIDVYTDWCGWCKVMDKRTFSNKELARYMNEHFYAVKFNAEQKDTLHFMGKSFGFVPQYRSNQFAAELLQGRMSYPTTVILDSNFQNPIPIPGFQDVATMEKILKYIATDTYKTVQFPEYEKTFVATWKEDAAAAKAPVAAGH